MVRQAYASDEGAQDAIARGFAEGGYRAALRRLAMYLGTRLYKARAGPFVVGDVYALAGEKDSALAWLERAYEAHDQAMPSLDQPDFDAVRDEPRFRDLCRRLNLPACS